MSSSALASPPIQDLAVTGDRRTCAYTDKKGNIVWYCPGRFDFPSLFASLLDPETGGAWEPDLSGFTFSGRCYVADSAILQTTFTCSGVELLLEDWMPMESSFSGLIRTVSEVPQQLQVRLSPRPHYAQKELNLQKQNGHICIDQQQYFYASHPVQVSGNQLICEIPAGEKAWFALLDQPAELNREKLEEARQKTLEAWKKISSHITYHGPYEQEVRNSLRMLRLMSFAGNGGLIAAGTTSLPEIAGGSRNYDYRYVWLRDAAMIVSALTRAGSDGEEERKFLSFICSAMQTVEEPTIPFFTLGFEPAPDEEFLNLQGYAGSQPIRIGNNANNQLQLDAISNVLLAAKLIYNNFDTREHWETVSQLADYLVAHWHEPDHGLWEETPLQHYTSSKVVASVSLKHISRHSQDPEQQQRWQKASADIRKFVEENCLTSEGAYAAFPGSEKVDVSALLFPIWDYVEADAPAVLKTVEALERDHCQNHLYRRYLVEEDASREGAFLAGTFWVAQYWVMRKDWQKFEQIMEAALAFMNDAGLMPEEGDPVTGAFLGNIPQTFVHASLIGTVIDYKNAREEEAGK